MPVTIKKKTVSPAMAKAWLAKRAPNRNIRERSVETLMLYMSRGEFLDTGDPVKFNTDGVLIDGQHRLSALEQFGKPMELWIAEGIASAAMPVLDIGITRKPNDTLDIWSKMKGRDWTNSMARASTLRILHVYDRTKGKAIAGGNTGGNQSAMTRFELVAAAEKHRNLDESIAVGVTLSHVLHMGCSVYAALHYLFSKIDQEGADAFFKCMATGELNGSGQANARVLREQIIAFGLAGRRMTTGETAYRVIRTWNATRRGERLTKIQLPKDMKQMQLPEIE
jgi:hypothetical protein